MAEAEQAAPYEVFDLIIFRWQNSLACEKDRSLQRWSVSDDEPLRMGFGLDVRLPITCAHLYRDREPSRRGFSFS